MVQDALVQFDQCSASVSEAAIIFRQLTEVGEFDGRQGAEAGLALLGPGKHGGNVQGALVGGAVTGRLATPSVEVVDRTFDELADGKQKVDLLLVMVEQGSEGLTQAAGALRGGRQRRISSLCYISYKHKACKMFYEKKWGNRKYFFR